MTEGRRNDGGGAGVTEGAQVWRRGKEGVVVGLLRGGRASEGVGGGNGVWCSARRDTRGKRGYDGSARAGAAEVGARG